MGVHTCNARYIYFNKLSSHRASIEPYRFELYQITYN